MALVGELGLARQYVLHPGFGADFVPAIEPRGRFGIAGQQFYATADIQRIHVDPIQELWLLLEQSHPEIAEGASACGSHLRPVAFVGELRMVGQKESPVQRGQFRPWTLVGKLGVAEQQQGPVLGVHAGPLASVRELGLRHQDHAPGVAIQTVPGTMRCEFGVVGEQVAPVVGGQGLPGQGEPGAVGVQGFVGGLQGGRGVGFHGSFLLGVVGGRGRRDDRDNRDGWDGWDLGDGAGMGVSFRLVGCCGWVPPGM